MLVRDPQLAHDGLLIRVFADEPARWNEQLERMVGGRAGEESACAFWLEHRLGPRQRSLSDLAPAIGRSLGAIDIEGTVQEIERAVQHALPKEWVAPVVVAAGWRIGVTRLRVGTMQQRAGLTDHLPPELAHVDVRGAARALRRRITMLREELIARGLIDRASAAATEAVVARAPQHAFTKEEREATLMPEERIETWPAIAAALGVSEDTAQRWAARHGLPVYQVAPDCNVWAVRPQLRTWLAERTVVR